MDDAIIKKMLNKLRENRDLEAKNAAEQFVTESVEEDNFLNRSKILMKEAVNKKKPLTESDDKYSDFVTITKNTPQFGDVKTSQEDMLRKTIGENVTLSSDALKYYPNANDMTLNGKIEALNISFQFRYNDPSGNGVYIFCNGMQLTDANLRTVGKVRDAFMNWKNSITQDADLMEKLKKAAEKN